MQQDILLVEDNTDDIDLSLEAFNMLGIENRVQVVKTGEDALSILFEPGKAKQWKVILLDMNLPGINGDQVLEEIRHHPLTNVLPVVMLTSSRRDEDKQLSYTKGVNSYVCKPVDFDEFVMVAETLKKYWLDTNEFP